ncbi:hypothetical protein [Flavobacterium sp.]|uniref:hypothetical protein n=1 Tax=Flavobacterium sp. TaxID=239 RepID=UPI0039E64D18
MTLKFPNITAVLISILCLSCKPNTAENDISIEIITKELISKPTSKNTDQFYITAILDIADSLPVNKIDVKISNSSSKTYVLYLYKNFDKVESKRKNIKSVVYHNNDILAPYFFGGAVGWTMQAYVSRKWLNERTTDSLTNEVNEIYRKKKVDFGQLEFQRETTYVVIHPNESRYFTFYRTFPYFLEDDFEGRYKYDFKENENYFFQVTLENQKKELIKNLDENQLKEINENGYTIFDQKIQSNKIPIHLIK